MTSQPTTPAGTGTGTGASASAQHPLPATRSMSASASSSSLSVPSSSLSPQPPSSSTPSSLTASTSSSSLNRPLPPSTTNPLRTRPRSGSMPMRPSRAPTASSSLRVEVLPDDIPSPPLPSSSSTPAKAALQSGSSSLSVASSRLRHIPSASTLNFSTSSPTSGRSRSGSITSPRPPNLSLLTPPTQQGTTSVTSPTSSSAPSAEEPSSSSSASRSRPRSGSAAPVMANNSFQKKPDTDLLPSQFNLTMDKGPPQSIDTWDPVIPDIKVHIHEDDQDDYNGIGIAGPSSPRAGAITTVFTEEPESLSLHDDEEEKILSTYQILNLIIPDISEASAAAEQREQQQQQQQQQLEADQAGENSTSPAVSQSTQASTLAVPNSTNSYSSNGSNNNERTMSEYLKANVSGATDYLAVTTLGLGAGLIPATVSGTSSRPATPLSLPLSSALSVNSSANNSTSALHPPGSSGPNATTTSLLAGGGAATPGSTNTPPATLAARFRLPFSSRAFIPPSRPASVIHQAQPGDGTAEYQGSSGLLGISNPMQMSTAQLNNNQGTGNRSSFFDYRLTSLLQFGAASSIGGGASIRSFDPTRASVDLNGEARQEVYEVEFNAPVDKAAEEARRATERTVLGRFKKMVRAGFPGRDLDPRTRKPRYKYPTNNIKTTKYTLLTFLPVNLLFQFKRFYNIYFLCAAIFVVAEPSLSPVTEILPLALVLTITAIKDALEDYRRYQQDKRSNSLECTLLRDGELIPIKSKDIRPGDVLRINKNDKIPADVVLISTSMDEGACFVETSELDGETNLKRKTALTLTSVLTSKEQLSILRGKITTEMPNERLSRLDGRIKVSYQDASLSVDSGREKERMETLQDQDTGLNTTTSGTQPSRVNPIKNMTRDTSYDSLNSIASSTPSYSSAAATNLLLKKRRTSWTATGTGGGASGAGSDPQEGPLVMVDEVAPVTMTNVVLRGSWLKNTEWVYGVVLYAGVDTKMMRNLKNTGLKFSTMETKLNRMIVAIFVFNAFLLIASMCFAYVGSHSETLRAPIAWYTTIEGHEFDPAPTDARVFVGQLMNFYVIYTFVIPISVFISVELCRVVQALWMIWDEEMRSYNDAPLSQAEQEEIAFEQGALATGAALVTDTKDEKALVRTATLTTDSTGDSQLTGKKKSKKSKKSKTDTEKTGNGFWSRGMLSGMRKQAKPKKKKKAPKNWTRMHVRNSNLNEDLGAVEYIFSDKTGTLTRNVMKLSKWHIGGRTFHELQQPGSLGMRMRDSSIGDEEYDLLMAFCRNIAVCHSVLPCVDSKTGELLYEAQSPDESALLEALRDNGVVLKARTKDSVTVEIFGLVTETYTLLKVLEFTSDRKCMSVIIDTPQGIQLFCKGADNVILAKADLVENDPLLMRQLDSTVRRFSIAGLRTLMLAWRPLSVEEYERFDVEYTKAEFYIEGEGETDANGATMDREELIRVACETIEGRLRLLGCTAIEDRLQDQVPETIEYLMEADVKIWLLTGDKQETAINIGISSRLISPQMKILVLNVKVERDCRLVLEYFVERIQEREREEERYWQEYQQALDRVANGEASMDEVPPPPEKERYALVVNGESLAFVLGNEIFEDMFLRIGTSCHSVICCRVTPLQKALVVKLVRKKLHKVTLAIGDGANDISMIQAAHVGVGIEGMEGAQAARSSDFSFKQFKNLKQLLTIHGRYSYLRMSKIIFFSFYKSICLITVQFWFGFMNGWSGGALYDEHFLTLWNMVFTALLPIATACFEKDVEEESIGKYPKLYKAVKDGLYWNTITMVGWGIASFWHSGVLFASIYGSISHGVVTAASEGMDIPMLSFYAGSLVLITVTLKMLLMISHYTMPIFAALGISMAGYVVVFIGLEAIGLLESGAFAALHSLPLYYFGLLVIPIACLLPDYTLAYVLRQYFPSDAQIVQEDQRVQKMRQEQLLKRKQEKQAAAVAAAGSTVSTGEGGGRKGWTWKGKNVSGEKGFDLDPDLEASQVEMDVRSTMTAEGKSLRSCTGVGGGYQKQVAQSLPEKQRSDDEDEGSDYSDSEDEDEDDDGTESRIEDLEDVARRAKTADSMV